MTKEITTKEQYGKSQLALITRTVAKGATPDELSMFIGIAKQTGLSPFRKEIYFIKYKTEDAVIMTSRDGFLSIAQKSGEFAGLQSAAVYENDEFSIDYATNSVKHLAKAKDRGLLIGAWAKINRKGCEPNITWVDFKTYNKGRNVWASHPAAMIIKCAESIALKKQFGISGLVAMEEMGVEPGEEPEVKVDSTKAFADLMENLKKVPADKLQEIVERTLKTPPFELTDEMKKEIKKLMAVEVKETK